MTSNNYSTSGILSDRYANALYDLSVKNNCIDNIIKDLDNILSYFNNNKDFNLLLKSHLISPQEKLKIINIILKDNNSNKLLFNFMNIISKNNRFIFLINIISRFNEINAEKRGDILIDITSAEKLTDKQKINIQNELNSYLKGKLKINYKINKSIIGGLIFKVGSKMIDSSITTKINRLKLAMKEA